MQFQKNKSLKELSTFGIGGIAKYFTEVSSLDTLKAVFLKCFQDNIPYFILGKGSNCLFGDKGFDGVVILNKIDFCNRVAPERFVVGAGYSFSLLGTQTARQELSGLEFASGIPGSVGGAVFMNAGANGNETCSSLQSVDFMHPDGTVQHFNKEELKFSYRTSSFQKMAGAIVNAEFALTSSPTARDKQIEIITYRKKTQPLKEKSAGCIFRNPSCGHAGALIEKSGLKGMQVGGAKVSEVHANFIVNQGNAQAEDVLQLIALIKVQVKEKMDVDLESEVRFIN